MTRIRAEKSTCLSYDEASQYAQDNNITSAKQWRAMGKNRPTNLPCNPYEFYKEWQGWPQFCKTDRHSKNFIWATYEECQSWARENNIQSVDEWRALKSKRPPNMPAAPDRSYKDVWPGWSEFLNNGRCTNGVWIPYEEAQKWACAHNIKSYQQYNAFAHIRPKNVPSNPDVVYKGVWPGWSKFLGNGVKLRNYDWATYEEASQWAQKQKIIGMEEWRQSSRPDNMPYCPDTVYKEKWKGWDVFLNFKKFVGISKTERLTRLVLDSVFDPNADPHRKQCVIGSTNKHNVDIAYPDLNLIIEYDGIFYHHDRENKDIEKTRDLTENGWTVVRVRETGLNILNNILNTHVVSGETIAFKVKAIIDHLIYLHNIKKIDFTWEQNKKLKFLKDNLDLSIFFEKMSDFSPYLSYKKASEWAKQNKIASGNHWRELKNERPSNLPACPEKVYKHQGWKGWYAFLGTSPRPPKKKKPSNKKPQ